AGGSLGEPLVLEHVEHGERGARSDRVAAEGGERPAGVGKSFRELAPRDDRGDRVAVPPRLPERDEVRRDAVTDERPESRPQPPVSGLDLVRHVETSGGMRPFAEQLELGRDRRIDPVAHERAVEERRGKTPFELAEPRAERCGEVGTAPRRRNPYDVWLRTAG